jgi:hypothetical protein
MMPQMIGGSPLMPFNQMGSNCGSMSFPLPGMMPQVPFPIPCPPAMIQPMMSPMSMRKITFHFIY